jgi:hypothetical protein
MEYLLLMAMAGADVYSPNFSNEVQIDNSTTKTGTLGRYTRNKNKVFNNRRFNGVTNYWYQELDYGNDLHVKGTLKTTGTFRHISKQGHKGTDLRIKLEMMRQYYNQSNKPPYNNINKYSCKGTAIIKGYYLGPLQSPY